MRTLIASAFGSVWGVRKNGHYLNPVNRPGIYIEGVSRVSVFKMYDCDFGVTLGGVNYLFTHVENMQIEDPERTKLIRGANAGNKTGLVYQEGVKEAKTVTLTVIGMEVAVHDLLKKAYKDKTRMDCFCISRADGSSKVAKNAILSQSPKQLTMDDSSDSLNTALVFESFDIDEIHKA